MENLSYAMLISNSEKPEIIRKAMIERYYELKKNASQTAREFKTKRQTVKEWVVRYEQSGVEGLKNLSRAPHTIPHKTPAEIEHKIAAIRISKRHRIGQDRIYQQLKREGIQPPSTSVINRILHQADLIQKRRRKWQKKRQCAEWRKTIRALRYWQIDVKYLTDIPELVFGIELLRFPKYEYTARDVLTGTTFLAYAYEYSTINSARFAEVLLSHLAQWGIHSSEIIIQSDNGPEMIGSITAKKDSALTYVVEQIYRAKHQTIPPATPRFNGSVESFHGRIEDELYTVEIFSSLSQFLSKSYTFLLDWNLMRVTLKGKTPFELIKQKTRIFDSRFCDWKPWILDEMRTLIVPHYQLKGVPFVADEVKRGILLGFSFICLTKPLSTTSSCLKCPLIYENS
jgi:transposase InsO family protein